MKQIKIFLLFYLNFIVTISWILSSNLSNWYEPWEICMFNSNNTINQPQLLRDYCWKKVQGIGIKPYFNECNIGGVRIRNRCATEKVPFNSKLYLQMSYTKELDNPKIQYLQLFNHLLSRLNSTFIPFGDSQMTSFRISIECENKKRNSNLNLISLDSNYVKYCNFLKPYESIEYLQNILTNLSFNYSHIFLLLNFGTHYNEISDRTHHHLNSKLHFQRNYPIILNWLNKLSSEKNYTIAWIETLPQHFSTYNGYYSLDILKNNTKKEELICSPIPLISTRDDWRNYEIREYLLNQSYNFIYYIKTYEMFAPLHKEHLGHDCTHYCWSPMMFQPIYKQLYESLRKDIEIKQLLFKENKQASN